MQTFDFFPTWGNETISLLVSLTIFTSFIDVQSMEEDVSVLCNDLLLSEVSALFISCLCKSILYVAMTGLLTPSMMSCFSIAWLIPISDSWSNTLFSVSDKLSDPSLGYPRYPASACIHSPDPPTHTLSLMSVKLALWLGFFFRILRRRVEHSTETWEGMVKFPSRIRFFRELTVEAWKGMWAVTMKKRSIPRAQTSTVGPT